MILPERLADFSGTWRVHRKILDARAGHTVTGQGEARLAPVPGGLDYAEAISLQVPGHAPVSATRRYLWRAAGAGIDVRFDDGRPFHAIALGQADVQDTHDCPPDHYAVHYVFAEWPRFSVHWTVKGPRKDYVMTTDYARATEPVIDPARSTEQVP